jgi:DGQHR domain-containing protein
MPSDVLVACSFATTKDEDPEKGFQRVLDERRATEIAAYIDEGGSIPNSIVLSAQADCRLKSVDRGKTLSFTFSKHAFLIIDGQHRIYGFAKAKTQLRVPVVIYENLTKDQEARLFIDINTKQRPVPKELLLAIRSLANSEDDIDARLGQIFELFHRDVASSLLGKTSSTKKSAGKIDRVTFYAGLRPHLHLFHGREVNYVYEVWNAFFGAVLEALSSKNVEHSIAKKTTFRAFCSIFPDVVQRVQDRFKSKYTAENFSTVMKPIFNLAATNFTQSGSTIDQLSNDMRKKMRQGLIL